MAFLSHNVAKSRFFTRSPGSLWPNRPNIGSGLGSHSWNIIPPEGLHLNGKTRQNAKIRGFRCFLGKPGANPHVKRVSAHVHFGRDTAGGS